MENSYKRHHSSGENVSKECGLTELIDIIVDYSLLIPIRVSPAVSHSVPHTHTHT